jgi:hypothetical protein
MIAFTTATGAMDGAKNWKKGLDGNWIVENMGVKMYPGQTMVVRIPGASYLRAILAWRSTIVNMRTLCQARNAETRSWSPEPPLMRYNRLHVCVRGSSWIKYVKAYPSGHCQRSP